MSAAPRSMPSIICFEDPLVRRLAPATTARPAYGIACGSFRLIDWLRRCRLPITGLCRPHLRVVQQLDYGLEAAARWPADDSPLLLVNARLVPSVELFLRIQSLFKADRSTVLRDPEGCVGLAYIAAPDLAPADAAASEPVDQLVQRLTAGLPLAETPIESFRWPHDIVSQHMRIMNDSLQWRIDQGEYTQQQDGVFLAPGATIGAYPVIDTSEGPIVIERDVQVGPFCYLAGPVHIGPQARVIEHAALKDAVALGHTTKVGGEVEASVIEPYTNKQHHGFLGHSYLGSWINLGAGTCNSDLKNTYGTINIEYGSEKVASGMQFMGCVMGDYAKSAINTGIFTGKVIGVCSMLYGFVTSNVPSFVNYARLFGQTATLPPEVMISTQGRMFARRKVQQRECDRQLIFDMFDLTEEERNLQAAIGL